MENGTRRIIAVDVDDTLFELNNQLRIFHNNKFGTNYEYDQIYTFNLYELWSCSPEESSKRIIEFYDHEAFKSLTPFEDALAGVNQLREKNDLIVVTSRPEEILPLTKESIEKHFPNCFTGIHCTCASLTEKKKRKKSEVCLERGASVMIDDHWENAVDCAQAGILSFLIRRPWNKSITDEYAREKGVIAAQSWNQIIQGLS